MGGSMGGGEGPMGEEMMRGGPPSAAHPGKFPGAPAMPEDAPPGFGNMMNAAQARGPESMQGGPDGPAGPGGNPFGPTGGKDQYSQQKDAASFGQQPQMDIPGEDTVYILSFNFVNFVNFVNYFTLTVVCRCIL